MADRKTYVYDIPSDRWTTFYGLDVRSTCILSGGNELDNVNLFLNSEGGIDSYPDKINSDYTTKDSYVKKYVDVYYSTLKDFTLNHVQKDNGSISVSVENHVDDFTKVKTYTKTSADNVLKRYRMPLGSFGDRISLIISGFKKIKNILLTYNNRSFRK